MSRNRRFIVAGLAVALLLAFVVSRWASDAPDGLTKVAQDHSLDATRQPSAVDGSPLAGYSTDGITDEGTSTGMAGMIGVAVTFLLGAGSGLVVTSARRRRRRAHLPRAVGLEC